MVSFLFGTHRTQVVETVCEKTGNVSSKEEVVPSIIKKLNSLHFPSKLDYKTRKFRNLNTNDLVQWAREIEPKAQWFSYTKENSKDFFMKLR